MVPSLLIGRELFAERGEGDGVFGMGVDDAVDVRPRPHHLGVDIDLVVARPVAGNLVAFDVHRDDVVVGHLLDADAAGLHQELVGIVGQPRRDVAPDVIALAFVDQDAAAVDELFAQFVGHDVLPSFCCFTSFPCPRMTSISAPASAGSWSARQATWPSGPHQHQPALIGGEHFRLVDLDDGQRHAALLRRPLDLRRGRRIAAETQQHEAAAEQVERRAAVVEPDMRRAGAGPGGLHVGMRRVGRRRRAVGPHDRRAVVAVAEHHAVGEPFVPHDGGEPVAVLLARGVACGARLEYLRAGQALAGRQHAAEIAARLGDVAQARPAAARPRRSEQLSAAPALDRRLRASSRDRPRRRCRCSCRSRRSATSDARRRRR